jgi:hypothetical protein
MKNIYFTLFVLLAIVSSTNAQTISRKAVSTGGGTLSGGESQVTFTIGETFGASLGGSSAIVTQGFQQPGERVRTGSVSASLCTGNSFKLPYTATDIGGNNTFTAQLSNAAGSFVSPINIGTLSGNASIAVIDVVIPFDVIVGSKYRIRVTSNSPSYIGADNGADITIIKGPAASISYSGSPYCMSNNVKAKVTLSGQSRGTYSASPTGLSIDSKKGDIDLAASAPGTYTVAYNYDNGNCFNTARTTVIINALPVANISYGNSSLSSSGSVNVSRTGQSGGTYSASKSGLSIDRTTGTINMELSKKGVYDVSYSFSNGTCTNTTTAEVTVADNKGTDIGVKDISLNENQEGKPDKFDVTAYPNPTNYQFNLVLENGSKGKVEITVYDMFGRLVKRFQSENEKSIQFGEDLRAGTYMVTISQGKNEKSVVLIKNN